MTSGARPAAHEIDAHIIWSGSMIRAIGRDRKDASPVNVDSKFCPARIPASKRIVVPLLPQSSGPRGARNPSLPTPLIKRSAPSRTMETPSSVRHDNVELQSALVENFLTREVP